MPNLYLSCFRPSVMQCTALQRRTWIAALHLILYLKRLCTKEQHVLSFTTVPQMINELAVQDRALHAELSLDGTGLPFRQLLHEDRIRATRHLCGGPPRAPRIVAHLQYERSPLRWRLGALHVNTTSLLSLQPLQRSVQVHAHCWIAGHRECGSDWGVPCSSHYHATSNCMTSIDVNQCQSWKYALAGRRHGDAGEEASLAHLQRDERQLLRKGRR